ncbi:MAG: roadblock/LC7 domain-containing protein [Cyanobacteria bacterium P01_A01_bin.45]
MLIRNIFSLLLGAFKRNSTSSENTKYLPPPTAENKSDAEEIITEDDQSSITIFPTNISPTNTSKKRTMINISMLQDVLQNFVTSTPDVQGVALVSPDGLSLASVLPTQMDEERTAAMSASILSLGERIGSELSRGGVERIVVEGEKGYGILVGCGSEAVLLVLASSTAKQGLLFLEIKRIATKITELLG